MTLDDLSFNLYWIFADHRRKEGRFVQQAMILVRKITEATTVAKALNEKIGDPTFAIAILGSECSPKQKPGETAPSTPLSKFTAGEYRVAVTCGVALEGYDNDKISLCVILRKIVSGRILFTQFVGRCKRMKKKLEGNVLDRTVATVFSYTEYGQKKMWDEIHRLGDSDPVEIDDDDQ